MFWCQGAKWEEESTNILPIVPKDDTRLDTIRLDTKKKGTIRHEHEVVGRTVFF